MSEFADALRLQRVLLKSFENWACPRFGVGEFFLQFTVVHSCSQFSSKKFLQRNSISPSFCPGALLLQSPLWHIDFPAGAASNCGLEIHRSCLKACDGMCAVFAWHAVLVETCFCLLAAFQFSPLAGSPAAPANSSGLFFANSFQAACHEFICLQRV